MTAQHYTDGSDWLSPQATQMTIWGRQETIRQLRQLKVERDDLKLEVKRLKDQIREMREAVAQVERDMTATGLISPSAWQELTSVPGKAHQPHPTS